MADDSVNPSFNQVFNTNNQKIKVKNTGNDYFRPKSNSMFKAIIIDDEFRPREVLAIKLNKYFPDMEIIGQASNITEGFMMCQNSNPNIVFLDISMPNGSGFDFLKLFEEINFEVIFVTAHSEYAIEAFKIAAIGYLLKPIIDDELIEVVNLAIDNYNFKDNYKKYQTLISNVDKSNIEKTKLVLPSGDRYEIVKISDIIYCEGAEKYTFIYDTEGRRIMSSYNIGKFKSLLQEPQFFLTHKSFIVNVDFIKSLTNEEEIILKNGIKVPLARRRKAEFLALLLGK